MRLPPAVGAALVLVGGALIALPVSEWLRQAVALSARAATPPPLLLVSLLSGILGLVLIFVAVVLSVETPPGPGGHAEPGVAPDRRPL